MWIYKITNIQNNKVYIGQTIRPIKDRFNRHINDAMNSANLQNRTNVHFEDGRIDHLFTPLSKQESGKSLKIHSERGYENDTRNSFS